MIGVIVDLLRAARRRTGVLVLLGALPVAAAVAGPAYSDAAQRSIVAGEVAAAKPNEKVLNFVPAREQRGEDEVFERLGGDAFTTPGFDIVFGTSFDVAPRTVDLAWKLSYRDGVCEQVTFDAGRCPTGRGEVMIGFHSATQLGAGVGDSVSFRQSKFESVEGAPQIIRLGPAKPLSIVGIYRPKDPTGAYWGPVSPFPPGLFTDPTVATGQTFGQVGVEPLFSPRATAMLYRKLAVPEAQAYDLVADPAQLTVGWFDRYPAELERLKAKAAEIDAGFLSGADPMVARIEQSRAAVHSLVPWLAMTVVPLCWFVIFLAAASGAETRRAELGQVAVRGLPLPHRWWLASGPDMVAVLAGAPFGWLAGQLVGGYAVPGGGIDLGLNSGLRRFALVAIAGTVLAVVLAYRPVVTGRAIDLVRNVTRQVGTWRSVTVDAMVVALAAFAVVEARTAEGPVRGGIATLAPVLLILAGALLAGRLLAPAARRAGRRALSAGRLAGALTGIELSRRSAPRRAVTLAVLGAALLCFPVIAVDAGDAARAQRAGIELGAGRVLDVNWVSGGTLRSAVRAADSAGTWAMAAVIIPATGAGPPTVAADTERLPTVAWPGSVPPEFLGPLRPLVAESVPVTGKRIQLDATVVMPTFDPTRDKFTPSLEPELRIIVQPSGEGERPVSLGDIQFGRHQYTGNLPDCRAGCRLVGVEAEPVPAALQLTVHEISQTGPDQVVAGPDVLDDPERWRASTEDSTTVTAPKLSAGAGTVTVEMAPSDAPQRLLVADAVEVLPVLRTTSETARETDTGWAIASPGRTEPAPATAIGALPTLPGIGAAGMLVDLEYLDRAAPMVAGGRPQVWVGPDAPADAVSRLANAGLTVIGETVAGDRADYADWAGTALAARYELVTAAFAVLLVLLGLGLVAAVERADRSARDRVLRAQGVAASTLRATARLLDLWPTLVGVLLGPLLALAAWAIARTATPVFLDSAWPLPLPALPDPVTLGLVWAACGLLFVLALARPRRLRRSDDHESSIPMA